MKIDFRGFVVSVVIVVAGCTKIGVQEGSEASTFKEAENCINSAVDACIFNKSAVSQSKTIMTAERLGGYQTSGVSLPGRDGSGFLQNSDFSVITASTERVNATKGFRQYYDPNASYLEQVMAYYYAAAAASWMSSRGSFPASGAGIKFVADSSFSGWVESKNEIHLERNGQSFPAALDASIILNLYAQANISKASGGASHTGLGAKAGACNEAGGFSAPYACCLSAAGCGPALVSGSADYFVAAFFGKGRTLVGDGWRNDPWGLTICGLRRDPALHTALTATSASSGCVSRGATHQANALGLLYASIWWEVRQKVTNVADFDKFFLKHLALIAGGDDFASIKSKILTLDTNQFSSAYGSLMSAEFARRGL